MSWMSSDMYDCKTCGHRSESSSEVHKCEFIKKSDLRKIVAQERAKCPKQYEPVLDHAIHNGREEVIGAIEKLLRVSDDMHNNLMDSNSTVCLVPCGGC